MEQVSFTFYLTMFVSSLFSLLPVVNPFSTMPVFLALTADHTEQTRRHIALKACRHAFYILLISLIAGSLIMEFFGISIAALRVAGGLIVAYIGFKTLFPSAMAEREQGSLQTGAADISFVPLALPSLSGPGSMAVVIGMSSQIADGQLWYWRLLGYGVTAVSIAAVCIIAWLVLRSALPASQFLGNAGLDAIRRVMAFLLVCIGIQFVASGILEFSVNGA